MSNKGQLDDSRSIWAKPFPASTTEEKVRKVFQHLGRISAVRLRTDNTGSFRGSVYVEFESVSGASSAVAHPPCQLKSTERLQILFKAEYDQKRNANATGPGKHANGARSDVAAGKGNGSSRHSSHLQHGHHSTAAAAAPSSGHKRSHGEASGGSWQQGGSQQQQQQHRSGASAATPPAATGAQFVPPLPPPPPTSGQAWAGLGGPPGGGPVNDRLAEMQQQLEQAHGRTEGALARADAAEGRESALSARAFAKDVELGALKGEVVVMKEQHASKVGLLTHRHQQVRPLDRPPEQRLVCTRLPGSGGHPAVVWWFETTPR
ncbi:MAG: hypothetical protein WDW38_002035 [Sanguina aurantia]